MHVRLVFVHALELADVGVAVEVVHDADLTAHVLRVLRRDDLALLGDGLAREHLLGFDVAAQRGDLRRMIGGGVQELLVRCW